VLRRTDRIKGVEGRTPSSAPRRESAGACVVNATGPGLWNPTLAQRTRKDGEPGDINNWKSRFVASLGTIHDSMMI
jgi:glycerol-3-phosphate dehydrogenase